MPDLRTILTWLDAHHMSPDAECWVLSADTVQPVTAIDVKGDATLTSQAVWADPTPTPLIYDAVYDRLIESYSGGGALKWAGHSETYRGSYVVNPKRAVFFLFLPQSIQIVESHQEKMEQRKQQARQLTDEIERARHA